MAQAEEREATEAEMAAHLLRMKFQWHPNKKADAWVATACYLLQRVTDRNGWSEA